MRSFHLPDSPPPPPWTPPAPPSLHTPWLRRQGSGDCPLSEENTGCKDGVKWNDREMGVSRNGDIPNWLVHFMENLKWKIWGYPYDSGNPQISNEKSWITLDDWAAISAMHFNELPEIVEGGQQCWCPSFLIKTETHMLKPQTSAHIQFHIHGFLSSNKHHLKNTTIVHFIIYN